ncbi:MAG: hypothetical protein Fur0046_30270 [Cyanobacteria bacterium J069]|nr:MAG: PAS domain S-box protein [Cyanobacteria bacterium J069]
MTEFDADRQAELAPFFPGDSEAARQMRCLDWEQTPVGRPAFWPDHLRVAVRLCLSSHLPMLLFWGPDFIQFYNTPYLSFVGAADSLALGRSPQDSSPFWHPIEPLVRQVFATGQAAESDAVLLRLEQPLSAETVYVQYTFAPLLAADGRTVDGVWGQCAAVPKPPANRPNRPKSPRRRRLSRPTPSGPEQTTIEQLAASQFRSMADTAPVLIWMSGVDMQCNYFNQPWLDFTGRSLQQELGHGWTGRIHPDDRPHCLDTYQAACHAREKFVIEYRLQRHDGEYRWLLDTGVPRFGPAGEFLGYIGSCVDITERKRIEQERQQTEATMRQREADLRLITNTVPVLISFIDTDQRYRFNNQRYEEWFGRPASEIYGKTLWEVLGEPAYEAIRPYVERVLAGEQVMFESKISYKHCGVRDIYAIYVPQLDSQGQVQGFVALVNDVSNLKQVESALRESEERLRVAQLAAKIGAWDWEIPTNRVFWTEENYTLYGMDRATPPSYQVWLSTVIEADRAATERSLWESLRQRQTHLNLEFRICHPMDGIRWLSCRGQIFYDAQGCPQRASGVFIDITDRKQTELISQEREQRLGLATAAARLGVFEWDAQTDQAIWENQRMYDILGHTEADGTLSKTQFVEEVIHPDDRALFEERLRFGMQPGNSVHVICRIRRRDNQRWRWVEINGQFTLAPDLTPLRLVGVVGDITDRKQVEADLRLSALQLQRSNERFEQAAAAVNCLIYDWDVEKDLVFRTEGLTRILGYSLNEIPFESAWWRSLIHPDDLPGVLAQSQAMLEGSDRYTTEYRVRHKDGHDVYVQDQGIVTRDAEGRWLRVVGSTVDISDRKRAEAEREQLLSREQWAREQAETANRIKDEFLAVLSHELRSPLNPILGWTQLLKSGRLDGAAAHRALETIERNAKLQTQLIEDLLDISRILQGKLVLHENPVDLKTTITAALETVRLAAEVKKIQIQTHLEAFPSMVFGDATRLQQVIWNLLTNAVKFTPEGGRIAVRLSQAGRLVQIQVEDNGKGINPEFLPYVFEYFRQEDSATTRRFGGLGLGLAIVRYLTELHGGTVQVASPGEGLGSTFTVSLPLMFETEADAEPTARAIVPDRAPDALAGLRVLVVDDDDDTRELVIWLLQKAGATVLSAASATEALTIAAESSLDLLISDVGMPEMDGYMLVRRIKDQRPHQTIGAIALTAYAAEGDAQQAIAAGFHQHLAKPIDPDTLITVILDLIQRIEESR